MINQSVKIEVYPLCGYER